MLISIIIPVYNGADVIGGCLSSVFTGLAGVPAEAEVIVVDDGSTDQTAEVIRKYPVRYLRIDKSGVASARNAGIELATGDILLFFDADVVLKEDTISKFIKYFEEDKDAYIIQGRWERCSSHSTFSSQFFLLNYHFRFKDCFNNSRRISVASLETGCLGVRREVFDSIKPFDTSYSSAGGEEFELGLRLLKKYPIFYYSDIFVEHRFGNIFMMLKKIYFRTVNYSMLMFNFGDKKIMDLHRTSVPNRDKVSVSLLVLMLLSIFLFFLNWRTGGLAFATLLLVYLLNMSRFIAYLYKEKGLLFAVRGGISDFIVTIPRMAGLIKASFLYHILRKRNYRI